MKQQQTKQVNKYDLLNIRIVLNCLLCLFVVRVFHKKSSSRCSVLHNMKSWDMLHRSHTACLMVVLYNTNDLTCMDISFMFLTLDTSHFGMSSLTLKHLQTCSVCRSHTILILDTSTRLGHQELPKNPGGTSRCDINKRPFLGEPYICPK